MSRKSTVPTQPQTIYQAMRIQGFDPVIRVANIRSSIEILLIALEDIGHMNYDLANNACNMLNLLSDELDELETELEQRLSETFYDA